MNSPDSLAPSLSPGIRPGQRSIESVLENRWARLLIPSLSDLFFIAMMVWLFAGGPFGWQGLLSDGDAGWHIRTGEWILDHGAVPYQDLFSFSKPGGQWFAWEWLADVIDAGLYRIAGLKGVVLFAAVIITTFATTLVRRMTWRGTHLFAALLLALLGVGASSVHFLARPHIFTLLFLSIAVWMIEADRAHASRRIWLLVPLTVVWTNLHGGFLSLIAILGLTAVGTAIEVWLGNGRTIRDSLRYGALTIACGAASLVNPYGWNLHIHVAEYLRSDWIRNVVQEFQSPSFRDENMLHFEALLLAGVLVAAGLLARKRVVEAIWIVFWVHMALGSVRHAPVYVTVAVPIIGVELGALWTRFTAAAKKNSLSAIINQMAADSLPAFRRTSILPFATVLALVLIGPPIKWPTDFPSQLFPTKMVAKHGDLILNSRVLTTDQWADYLIFRNPQQRVFVDGRSDFYGKEIGLDYMRVLNGHWKWRQILDQYQFNLALVPVDMAIAQLLKSDPQWRAVEDDGKQILLVRTPTSVPSTRISPNKPRF